MDRGSGSKGDFPVLPAGSLPCVWMLAGVMTYRLCDRTYDCERCPLDAGMRGVRLAPELEAVEAPVAPLPWGLRDDRRYDPVGGWVEAVDGNRFRWGLDGLLARLFDRPTSVVLPAVSTDLEQGQVACWLEDDGELIPLPAPVSGRVLQTNPAVQRNPGLITALPYDDGWLVEMRGRGPLRDQPGLCGVTARRESAAGQMVRLQQAALRAVHDEAWVGPTAADGGQRITDLRRMLGTRRYHRLILSILR